SYHDVLHHAGLRDIGAEHFEGWPQYDPEQVLSLDPEIIVTHAESIDQVCRTSGLEHLRACQNGARGVVGIDGPLMGDPGPRMLEAAERLRELVYGRRPLEEASTRPK